MLHDDTTAAAKVLIVEDEFLIALQLERIVTDAGHEVIGIAPDRAAASAVAQPPELALIDVNLRDGPSGPTIGQSLAERFGTKIVYVTANPAQIGRPAGTAIGVVDKPFSDEAIRAAIRVATTGEAAEPFPELDLYCRQAA